MTYIVANCADMLTSNGSDAARCITYWHNCLILEGFSLNGYIMFSLWHVFVICSNSEDIKNNLYEIPCTVYFDCLADHRCIRGPIDCGKGSPKGQ